MPGIPFNEVEETLIRSQALVSGGVVAGVRDVQGTALFLAATEIVDQMDFAQIVRLVREGLEEGVTVKEEIVREVAVFVLLHQATRRNGSSPG